MKKNRLKRSLTILICLLLVGYVVMGIKTINKMPGHSYSGPSPPLTIKQQQIRQHLRKHVDKLAGQIGERNFRYKRALDSAADYIELSL